jgi:DNA-binding transcriptional LysR family regulator
MEIDLTKFAYLVTIARTRNFSRAADELRITQPALSRSVAAVEQRFGFKIFDRGRGGVSITPLGALVLKDAETLLRDARAKESVESRRPRGVSLRRCPGTPFGQIAGQSRCIDLR